MSDFGIRLMTHAYWALNSLELFSAQSGSVAACHELLFRMTDK